MHPDDFPQFSGENGPACWVSGADAVQMLQETGGVPVFFRKKSRRENIFR